VGNPHAGFDEAGAGNGLSGTAPAFDPTLGGEGTEKSLTYPTWLNPSLSAGLLRSNTMVLGLTLSKKWKQGLHIKGDRSDLRVRPTGYYPHVFLLLL